MIILAIETSCDDTGVALVECDQSDGCKILSNVVSSQIKIHAPYGGVVPNLAARAHLKNIQPCFEAVFKQTRNPKIDLLVVTVGPGLIPCLLIGVNFAKALAYQWQKPIVGVNHLEAHIYANWLKPVGAISNSQFPIFNKSIFPALCLIVSGGHTQLVLMKDHNQYQLLGQTRDDAAGEAFDKVAKLLGLGYPGGPIISQRAKRGNPQAFNLPRPMIDSSDFDFSFSGLKTAVLYLVKPFVRRQGLNFRENSALPSQPIKLNPNEINNLCASFQQAVVDVLIAKTIRAAKKFRVKTILLAGGVAANKELRQQMGQKIKENFPNSKFRIPDSALCTDNAAMVATAGFYKIKGKNSLTYEVGII